MRALVKPRPGPGLELVDGPWFGYDIDALYSLINTGFFGTDGRYTTQRAA